MSAPGRQWRRAIVKPHTVNVRSILPIRLPGERPQAWELRLLYSAGNPAQRETARDLTVGNIMEREWDVKIKAGFTLE